MYFTLSKAISEKLDRDWSIWRYSTVLQGIKREKRKRKKNKALCGFIGKRITEPVRIKQKEKHTRFRKDTEMLYKRLVVNSFESQTLMRPVNRDHVQETSFYFMRPVNSDHVQETSFTL
ncbi:hypothetical protein CEXT_634661 [Caerostris extrusa]|uniref:Uncharacterized protein n=1 Tax=Caerostris extrusa TaxID=172846 RepID=A0AAV4RUU6_CAEEX|nr:hypothetical protein CEXT_634661 [Caerostris extrusa]